MQCSSYQTVKKLIAIWWIFASVFDKRQWKKGYRCGMHEESQTGVFIYDLGGMGWTYSKIAPADQETHTCAYFFFDLRHLLQIKEKKKQGLFFNYWKWGNGKLREYIFKNEGKDNRFECKIMKREAAIIKMQKKNTWKI